MVVFYKKMSHHIIKITSVLILLIIILLTKFIIILSPGDILFGNQQDNELSKAITEVGINYGYPVNHVAIYIENGQVLESTTQSGVTKTKLNVFIKRYKYNKKN